MNMNQNDKQLAAEIGDLTFRLLSRCQLKEQRFASQFNLTAQEFRVIRNFRGEKSLTVRELVHRIQLSGSRLTRILDDLERKKYLRRTVTASDRRVVTVSLTAKGHALSSELEQRFAEIHEEIFRDVPAGLREQVVASFRQVLVSLDAWLQQ